MLRLLEDSCALQIGVLGINFKTASLDLREKISRRAEKLVGEPGIFFRSPMVVLSTCNRTEMYFSGEDLSQIHSDLLEIFRSKIEGSFEHFFYSYFGIDCFTHLCKVTAGLDSAILAETEIQRQVKLAYEQAVKAVSLPPNLHYVFQKALKVGKEVRNRVSFTFSSPSLTSAIWQLSRRFFSDIFSRKVLFVGYSDLNRQLMTSFLQRKMKHLTLCTQNPSDIHFSEVSIVGREILRSWTDFDLVICASKADQYLIRSPGGPKHLVFDLSVPRNVDPLIANTSQLYNIEQIHNLIESHQKEHSAHLMQEDLILRSTVRRLAQIYRNKKEAHSLFASS